MNDQMKCETCGATDDVDFYTWPVIDETTGEGIEACPEHAIETGFCPMCGYFVAGSGDEYGMRSRGCCTQCHDEFHTDWDDSDFSDEEWTWQS